MNLCKIFQELTIAQRNVNKMKSNHQEGNLGKTTELGTTTNYYHQCIALVVDWCMTHVTKCVRVTLSLIKKLAVITDV